MPAKRTVPMRSPPSSRTDTISPGMPRHIRSALLLRDDEPTHSDVGMDLEHEEPGRLEVVLAEVEGAFALDLECAIVDRTERDFTLDGTCDAMELQLSRDAVAPAVAERFDGAHRAPDNGEFSYLEPALDLVIVQPVAGPETVGVDLDTAGHRRAVLDATVRERGVEVSFEPARLRADRVEARRRLHPDARSLGHDPVSTHRPGRSHLANLEVPRDVGQRIDDDVRHAQEHHGAEQFSDHSPASLGIVASGATDDDVALHSASTSRRTTRTASSTLRRT